MNQKNRKNLYRVYSTRVVEGHHDVEAWSPEGASEKSLEMGPPKNEHYVDDSIDIVDVEQIERPVEKITELPDISKLLDSIPTKGKNTRGF